MSKTVQRAGRLVAAYVEDGQGRRVVLAEPGGYVGARVDSLSRVDAVTLVVGTTQAEVRETIRVLYQLLEELPVGDGPDPRTRKEPIAL